MKTKIAFAGQFTLDAIDIIQPNGLAVDIREQVAQLTIYEDIFSPFLSGNIIFIDTADLPSFLGRAGVDLLRLRIYTPTIEKEHWIDRYFHIYKMSDQTEYSDRSQSYILHFVSQENVVDTSINISRTFKGSGASNIESILRRDLLTGVPFNAGDSSNEVVYTSNLWTSTKNIRYNCDHSLSGDGTASLLFYESRKGFNFKALTEIAKQNPVQNFVASNHISTAVEEGVDNGSIVKDINQDFGVILRYAVPLTYDYIMDKSNGMLNSRMFSYDSTTKKISDVTFNENSDKHKLLNDQRFYTEQVIDTSYRGSVGSIILHNKQHIKLYDGKEDVSDFPYKQKRISIIRQYQQHKIEITVLGRTDYTVGEVVNADFNRLMPLTRDTPRNAVSNPLYSGKYIVAAVCHRFTRDGKHETTLELMRDSIRKYK